jgi:hypothetical protein
MVGKQREKHKPRANVMRYTPHTLAELSSCAQALGGAVGVVDGLHSELLRRGSSWGMPVDLQLAQLNDDMQAAAEEGGVGRHDGKPKVKPTLLRFRCVAARAAVTEALEITRGRREPAIGWLRRGDVVQAKMIGDTALTGRQRILDAKPWKQGKAGLPGEGWISIRAVDGTLLLERILGGAPPMPKAAIRVEVSSPHCSAPPVPRSARRSSS